MRSAICRKCPMKKSLLAITTLGSNRTLVVYGVLSIRAYERVEPAMRTQRSRQEAFPPFERMSYLEFQRMGDLSIKTLPQDACEQCIQGLKKAIHNHESARARVYPSSTTVPRFYGTHSGKSSNRLIDNSLPPCERPGDSGRTILICKLVKFKTGRVCYKVISGTSAYGERSAVRKHQDLYVHCSIGKKFSSGFWVK